MSISCKNSTKSTLNSIKVKIGSQSLPSHLGSLRHMGPESWASKPESTSCIIYFLTGCGPDYTRQCTQKTSQTMQVTLLCVCNLNCCVQWVLKYSSVANSAASTDKNVTQDLFFELITTFFVPYWGIVQRNAK